MAELALPSPVGEVMGVLGVLKVGHCAAVFAACPLLSGRNTVENGGKQKSMAKFIVGYRRTPEAVQRSVGGYGS